MRGARARFVVAPSGQRITSRRATENNIWEEAYNRGWLRSALCPTTRGPFALTLFISVLLPEHTVSIDGVTDASTTNYFDIPPVPTL